MRTRAVTYYAGTEEASREKIDYIEELLHELKQNLEQEKADHGRHDWADVGSLGHVAEQLEQIATFWRNAYPK